MFTTRRPYKVPYNFEPDTDKWRLLELTLNLPWFVCIAHHVEDQIRCTYLLSSDIEVFQFARFNPQVPMKRLTMALPPRSPDSRDWRFLPIQRVEVEKDSGQDSTPKLVFTAVDGSCYSGPFLTQTLEKPSDLELVFELSDVVENAE